MKNFKFTKRICVLLMATIMMLVTSVPAFAAEANSECTTEVNVTENMGIMPLDAQYTSNSVASSGEGSFSVHLNSYLGFSKKLTLDVLKDGTVPGGGSVTGKVTCIIYAPNGNLFATYSMTAGGSHSESFTLPSSGWYSIIIWNDSNIPVKVRGQWT